MLHRSLLVLLACAIGLAVIVWLAAASGLLPAGTFGGNALTRAPDKSQPYFADGARNSKNAASTAPAQSGANPVTASAPTTPAPARPSPPVIRYTTSHTVNMRAGAGTNHAVVGQVQPGDIVTLLKDPGGNWIRVRAGETSGWVYKSLFRKE